MKSQSPIVEDKQESILYKDKLDKVMQERDLLATKLKKGSKKSEERYQKLKDYYELQMTILRQEIKEHRSIQDQKDCECEQLNAQLMAKQLIHDELSIKHEELTERMSLLKT